MIFLFSSSSGVGDAFAPAAVVRLEGVVVVADALSSELLVLYAVHGDLVGCDDDDDDPPFDTATYNIVEFGMPIATSRIGRPFWHNSPPAGGTIVSVSVISAGEMAVERSDWLPFAAGSSTRVLHGPTTMSRTWPPARSLVATVTAAVGSNSEPTAVL